MKIVTSIAFIYGLAQIPGITPLDPHANPHGYPIPSCSELSTVIKNNGITVDMLGSWHSDSLSKETKESNEFVAGAILLYKQECSSQDDPNTAIEDSCPVFMKMPMLESFLANFIGDDIKKKNKYIIHDTISGGFLERGAIEKELHKKS